MNKNRDKNGFVFIETIYAEIKVTISPTNIQPNTCGNVFLFIYNYFSPFSTNIIHLYVHIVPHFVKKFNISELVINY